MQVLVISDIHANLTALDAVLHDAGAVDAVWCLGDLVGYGPDPNEVIRRVRELPGLVCLLGNHDAAALGQIEADSFNTEARLSVRWVQENLSPDSISFLSSLREQAVIADVTLTHGSPRNPVWEYILDARAARSNFAHFDTSYCFVGHTHLPVLYADGPDGSGVHRVSFEEPQTYQLNGRAILNPGSVGQPRDRDPRAAYALFQPEERLWSYRRTPYAVQAVQERILSAGLPARHAMRLAEGW